MFSDIDENLLITEAKSHGINRFVVGAVIRKNDHVLLLKRKIDDFMGGIYELPSGKVEDGERFIDALIREVAEETSLEISVTSFIGYFDYVSKSGRTTRQFNFYVFIKSDEVQLSDEHEEFVWINENELRNYDVTEPIVKIISHFELKGL